MTREIVIAAAKACISPLPCKDCPYRIEGDRCINGLIADLLKIVADSEKSTSSAAYPAALMEHRYSGLITED